MLPRSGVHDPVGGRAIPARTEHDNEFAAGDVAIVAHPFYGSRLRVEHWASALDQPDVVARSMLDKPGVWDRLPYFSDQYDVGMEYTGLASAGDEVVLRGDRDARELIAFWLRDDRVVAGMSINVWDVTDDIEGLIRARHPVDRRRLADPDVPLADLLTAPESARTRRSP